MICPLFDLTATAQQKAHGCACGSPVCPPSNDCRGSLTGGNCTVPAFVWRILVIEIKAERGGPQLRLT